MRIELNSSGTKRKCAKWDAQVDDSKLELINISCDDGASTSLTDSSESSSKFQDIMKSRKQIDDPKAEHVVLSCNDGASTLLSDSSVSPLKLQDSMKSKKCASTLLSDSSVLPLKLQDSMKSRKQHKRKITDLGSTVLHPATAVAVPPPRSAIIPQFNSFGTKRKCPKCVTGIQDSMFEHTPSSCDDCVSTSLSYSPISPLTFQDHMKSRKRHKGKLTHAPLGSPSLHPTGVVTVPPPRRRANSPDNAPKGLKRKSGCIESAIQTGRKEKIESKYDLGPELGRGKFGVVRVCRNKATSEEMACKTLPKKGPGNIHNEVQVMQHLSGHPNIVMLKAVFEDADFIHLVMEICSGGRLVDSMRKNGSYSEQQSAKIIKELVEVIKYCHEMGVVHRDIKPENILLTSDGKVKLADFGLSVHAPKGRSLSGLVGSPAYVAPETFSETYTEKVDVWAAGVLLHALLIGVLPFRGESVEAIFEKIKGYEQLDFQTENWKSVSGPAKDLLSRMLSRDAENRLSSEDVLCHPWIMFYTDPRIRLQTKRSRKRYKSHVRSDQHKNPMTATSKDRQGRNQDTANLIPNKRSEDDSISGHFQRTLLLNAACCTRPSYPAQLDHVVTQHGECDLVDVLSAAISQLTISRPKRSRGPTPAYVPPLGCSDNGECVLVDVLSAAISQLTISRPKRSRGPTPAYVPPLGCSQNLHMTLCKAF